MKFNQYNRSTLVRYELVLQSFAMLKRTNQPTSSSFLGRYLRFSMSIPTDEDCLDGLKLPHTTQNIHTIHTIHIRHIIHTICIHLFLAYIPLALDPSPTLRWVCRQSDRMVDRGLGYVQSSWSSGYGIVWNSICQTCQTYQSHSLPAYRWFNIAS